jgi:hypothetical protein
MPLGVVILHEAVVSRDKLLPTLSSGEVEIGHPALNIEDTPNRIHP